MAEGLGARVVALEAPFNPEGGAYVEEPRRPRPRPRHHDHDHDHDHDHGHAHDAATTAGETTITQHDHGHDHAHDHDHGTTDMGTTTPECGGAPLPLSSGSRRRFPVGAFAYSHGLEWAVEAGDIADATLAQAWLDDLIEFGAPRSDAILFSVAFRTAAAADWPALM